MNLPKEPAIVARQVVWVKMRSHPWWPAQVIETRFIVTGVDGNVQIPPASLVVCCYPPPCLSRCVCWWWWWCRWGCCEMVVVVLVLGLVLALVSVSVLAAGLTLVVMC